MKSCPLKENIINKENKHNQESLISKEYSFICSNCFNKQLINSKFIYKGYCTETENNEYHNHLKCKIDNNDEIVFICSYEDCKKISFNYLNGKPKYNINRLDNKSLEILNILLQENKKDLYNLIKEYFLSLNLNLNSSATLLARKILIHFACELGCEYKKYEKISYYVDYIKNDGILSKNWNNSLDIVRKLGNDENHQLKIATNKELETVKIIMEQLINSHFLPQIYK